MRECRKLCLCGGGYLKRYGCRRGERDCIALLYSSVEIVRSAGDYGVSGGGGGT